ncbi:hypothetical protein IWX76_002778 [Pedobacter sp. CAN_A7]
MGFIANTLIIEENKGIHESVEEITLDIGKI